MTDKADFYKKLKETIENTTDFPTEYLFKFIIPTDDEKLKQLKSFFKHPKVKITTRLSKNGKYTSVSILSLMQNSDEIINKYKQVAVIKSLISL